MEKKNTQRKLNDIRHSPLFPVELEKGKQGVSTYKNADFPQEGISDSRTITKKRFRVQWRPNNYRRQIKVKIKIDSTLNVLSNHFGSKCVIGKRNKLFTTKFFVEGVTLQYGRDKLTAMYPQRYIDGEKEVFVIEHEKFSVCEDWIISKRKEIKEILDNVLFKFARKFNIVLPVEMSDWVRGEDWTIDKEIELIPEWTIVHGENIKKVYPKGIEFTSGKGEEPALMLINRVRNNALKDFSPDIVSELDKIRLVQGRIEALSFLKDNVRCPGDLVKYSGYYELLSDLQKDLFCGWVYDNMELMYSGL